MSPTGLFPVTLHATFPPLAPGAPGASVDAWGFGVGDNGAEYVLKTIGKTPRAPCAEWFCHGLAQACNLVVPQYDKIQLPDGTLAFGSQWEGGAVKDQALRADILTGNRGGHLLAQRLSAIYAFDLFVNNDDRHPGNYLFVEARTDITVKAYDFSRAWIFHDWPLPSLPMPATSNTVAHYRNTRNAHPFDYQAAESLLDAVRKVPVSVVKGILDQMPESWVATPVRKKILKWWAVGGEMRKRVDDIKKGLKDGSYL